MAVIGKIRKHSGLLVIVIGVALAAFVLGDFSKAQTKTTNIVGEVNGEKITYKEFSEQVESNLQYQKQQQQKQSLTPAESFYVREQTWNQQVNKILLENEYESLGLAVSVDELAELLHGSNPHYLVRQNFSDPQTGVFNPDRVKELLRTLDQMDLDARQRYYNFEQTIKSDQVNTKFSNLIRKAYYVPESIAKKMADNNVTNAIIKLLAKDISSVSDDLINVTEDDLESYYNEHIDDFQLKEENRAIDYVVFDVVPSVKDRTETTELVNELFQEFLTVDDPITFVNSVSDHRYDSNYYKISELPIQISQAFDDAAIGTFVEPYLDNESFYMAKLIDKQFRPDSMLASHVLISYQGSQNSNVNRTKAEAYQFADSIYKVINRNPSKLPEIAQQLSDDPSAKTNSGDLGWFADMTMLTDFNNAVVRANVGEVVMVETVFGYHIIEVNGKKDISRKYRVAVIDRSIEASSQTFQDFWTKASKFAAENTDYDSFSKAVAELGLNKRSYSDMIRMTSNIYDLVYPRQIVRWAFSGDTEVGSISPIFDFEGKYVISILTDIEEKGSRAFEKVKDAVELKVREEKKIEYILNEINGITDFEAIAQKWDKSVEDFDVSFNLAALGSHGREPEVVGEVFGMQKGEFSTVVGKRGVYVVNLKEIKIPDIDIDVELYRTQITSAFTNKIYQNAIIRALVEQAEIDDDRHLFY